MTPTFLPPKNKGGRPVGSKNKIKFKDHMSSKDITKLVETAKTRAQTDSTVLKFLLEQVFGRAVQTIGNENNEPFKLQIIRANEPTNGNKNDKTPPVSG